MSERFNETGYNSSPETGTESPDRVLLGEAGFVAVEMLRATPEEPLTREIAEKILSKIRIKDHVDELYDHADDTSVYQEFKKLGIFVVRDAEATFDYEDMETGFSLSKGERYLDLHLPPVPQDFRSREVVEASLDLIREYILDQELEPKYVMGVTYQRMAELAERRFGFNVAYPNPRSLPDGVVEGVQRVYEGFTQAGRDDKEIGLPAIVFQDFDNFMRILDAERVAKQQDGARILGGLAIRSMGI